MAPTVSIEFSGNRGSKKFSQKVNSSIMGKTRKVSKGNSRGSVPEHRHAIDTMVESDPYSLKRKNISLNGDANEQFGVPIQVLSLSKLSTFQRKDLVLKLKHELDQVRTFQKEIATVRSIPKPVPQTIKRVPPGQNVVGSTKKVLPLTSWNAILMKQCETLLKRLIGHTFGWVFKAPVDVVALKIPDYYTAIKHPMDLGTVKTKLTSGRYTDPLGFAADVRLTFSNALTYNPRGNNVYGMAETLSKYFEMRWKQIEKKLVKVPQKPTINTEAETVVIMSPLKKRNILCVEKEVKQVPVAKRVMSAVEKQEMSSELESLLADLPENIIDFLKEKSCNGYQISEDEIEIDIDTMSDDTLFILRKLLDVYLSTKQKNTVENEIELSNGVGFNNSSMQPCKANDVNEEDLDIGGNDLPISSFPPIEIKRDSAVGKSKSGNSSSSSSIDGSSSSDSDSGTYSDSVADCAKASSTIVNSVNLILDPEKTAVSTVAEPENHPVHEVSQVEQKSWSSPVSGEVDGRQEGESVQSKKQVSPVKLHRAALLKIRFVDTILKAQEKTIEKGNKQDPERSRLEELLEKRRKTEKARLQAEAKAAEEARRKAEAEVAAKAKRKRELEREAARQALQNMEKTVYIDENSQFLEDLEMLGGVPSTEPLQSLIDETSPLHSLDPLGSFKFLGNNPLEQLGLYMKDDNEDEKEDATAMIDDPEEGEID